MSGTKFYAAVGIGVAAVIGGTLLFREDKAKPHYRACLDAEAAGNLLAASAACEAAMSADASSTAGKAAAAKLKEMEPAITKAKAAKEAADAKAAAEKAKTDEAARATERKANAQKLMAAMRNANIQRVPSDDGSCLSNDLPPRAYRFEARPADADAIANAGRCTKRFWTSTLLQRCPADFEQTMQTATRAE